MIVFFQPSQSYQYFKVRTAPLGCSGFLDVRIQVTDAESLSTASYTPTTLFLDNYGFLNVEAQMALLHDTVYKIELIQQSASSDCNTIYRGELYYMSGSATKTDSRPFISYDKQDTQYVIW
jgi:hypothetical protein